MSNTSEQIHFPLEKLSVPLYFRCNGHRFRINGKVKVDDKGRSFINVYKSDSYADFEIAGHIYENGEFRDCFRTVIGYINSSVHDIQATTGRVNGIKCGWKCPEEYIVDHGISLAGPMVDGVINVSRLGIIKGADELDKGAKKLCNWLETKKLKEKLNIMRILGDGYRTVLLNLLILQKQKMKVL